MTEGDELLAMIRQAVADYGVPPSQQPFITDMVARIAVTVMTDPRFLYRLSVVLQLQEENQALRHHIAMMQTPTRSKAAPRKKASPKKRVVKKAPAVQVRGSTKANRQAFRQGYRGA
jgi:hypothetical protein